MNKHRYSAHLCALVQPRNEGMALDLVRWGIHGAGPSGLTLSGQGIFLEKVVYTSDVSYDDARVRVLHYVVLCAKTGWFPKAFVDDARTELRARGHEVRPLIACTRCAGACP